ncbi:GNAT family N-acetyltransferase [Hahella sp. CCB-MM4]|uniref:GNAT family N-acetyltransferase n=1 Tax=Hahella sp. (strain CCB-MM4) TaxID=1926491 RepID=UPI000B9C3D31|nr:GNAT family N-acetyltransferase [Hahella sp. CCB-MM4]OZG75276.1 GNAT family N-acetyltransferase [Hahella sp. CCB-MM4]
MKSEFNLRPIEPSDNPDIAGIIRTVSIEYGLSADNGYGVCDASVDHMYETYQVPGAAYWIVERGGRIFGGGGIAPLKGDSQTAELQKMYFLAECRGHRLGFRLAEMALTFATEAGYKQCYLETTAALSEAIALYQRMGFRQIASAMGCTGHSACEIRMLKALG